jgi:hypothetical protein
VALTTWSLLTSGNIFRWVDSTAQHDVTISYFQPGSPLAFQPTSSALGYELSVTSAVPEPSVICLCLPRYSHICSCNCRASTRSPRKAFDDLIVKEWSNIQRIMASLAHKDVTQATIVRKLSKLRAAEPNQEGIVGARQSLPDTVYPRFHR